MVGGVGWREGRLKYRGFFIDFFNFIANIKYVSFRLVVRSRSVRLNKNLYFLEGEIRVFLYFRS